MCSNFRRMIWRRAVHSAALMLSAFSLWVCPRSTADEDTASGVLRLTGARTRIVWAHQVKGEPKRWGSGSSEFALMGFDTEQRATRVILPGPDSYANPSITADGSRVVFTDAGDGTIYAVDWNGANRTKLASGFALCAWVDPATGVQWIYAGKAEFSVPTCMSTSACPRPKRLNANGRDLPDRRMPTRPTASGSAAGGEYSSARHSGPPAQMHRCTFQARPWRGGCTYRRSCAVPCLSSTVTRRG